MFSDVTYPGSWWYAYLTALDVECAVSEFGKWWEKAGEHVPEMEERARVAMLVVSRAEHMGILVNIVADAYRKVIDA